MNDITAIFAFLTIALYRYHAITAIGTACIAAIGTKISVLLFNLQR